MMCFSYPVCRLAGSSFAKTDVSMTDEDIKRSIRLKREELGMTQKELAERLGIDRNTFRSLETGGKRMLNAHLYSIAEIFGMDVLDLIGSGTSSGGGTQVFSDVTAKYESRLMDERRSYDEKLRVMGDRLRHAEELVQMLRQQVQDKEDIINLLRSRKNQ